MSEYLIREKILMKLPILRVFKAVVIKRIRKLRSNYGKEIIMPSKGNELIEKLLKSNSPFMVARLGSTELECVTEYLNKNNSDRGWNEGIRKKICTLSGFFPSDDSSLDRFSKEFLEHVKNVDVMGVWYNPNEDVICRQFCSNASLVSLTSLEPYYHSDPWSKSLVDKKVLVIHPYAETIKHQYQYKRESLFTHTNVLPHFDLQTIQAVQSIANNKTDYNSWFDAYGYMCDEIAKRDFDVAIIGAGAYGLPLASFIKNMGKQAIHMGGATQILFGIKGKRWDDHKIISSFYNDDWVRPSSNDIPQNYKNVEGGCYW
ncbi:hypothetical protein [Paenibacillus abyssi]|uniref:Uncharacterized protein n=1 Tax=Paenibacillus abyssi TaxID=1340531 RepID=A0A917LGT2_9BACL|nr:hypothetical protein [Paenibacillus abyssi]GGG21685.1 hypothetical protein GCM10010916_42990 [Paenibacillus abyssi]